MGDLKMQGGKMRIYSSTLLSWPQLLHVSQVARLQTRPDCWHNYYFYRLGARSPTNIITYSPITLLQEDRQYYCYDKLQRNKLPDSWGNVSEIARINNCPPPFPTEQWVTIPYHAAANDIIVIEDARLLC